MQLVRRVVAQRASTKMAPTSFDTPEISGSGTFLRDTAGWRNDFPEPLLMQQLKLKQQQHLTTTTQQPWRQQRHWQLKKHLLLLKGVSDCD